MKKIVLHACCAPCASYPINKLIEDDYKPVVFFYNPNIYPVKEYEIRRNELKNYCAKLGIDFFEKDYDENEFLNATKGLENEPEKGKRCIKCFELRLEKTAKKCVELGILNFTTTLTVSPHKISKDIFKVGDRIAKKYGLEFLKYDFKKNEGFKITQKIARELGLYKQTYCGCEYSIKAKN